MDTTAGPWGEALQSLGKLRLMMDNVSSFTGLAMTEKIRAEFDRIERALSVAPPPARESGQAGVLAYKESILKVMRQHQEEHRGQRIGDKDFCLRQLYDRVLALPHAALAPTTAQPAQGGEK